MTFILFCALEKCTEDFKEKFKETVTVVAHAETDKVSMDFVSDSGRQTITRTSLGKMSSCP